MNVHILYLVDELKVRGGSEKSLLNLVGAMQEKGFRVSVFCLQEGGFAEQFRKMPGIFFACLQVVRIYDVDAIRAIWRLRAYIKEQQVDIVQTMHTASDLLGPLLTAWLPRRCVLLSSRRDMGFTKADRHVRWQRILNRRVDGILANSLAVKKSVHERESFPLSGVTVIANGIFHAPYLTYDRQQARQEMIAALGVATESVFIGNAGNLHAEKGHAVLLEAMHLLQARYPSLCCLIAGAGSLLSELQEYCRQHLLAERVFFLGNREEMPSFYSALAVYVQPSHSEGFSNAILEAMAAGCPVVASAVGGNPDCIADGVHGYVFPAGDAASLAEFVARLLDDHQSREKMTITNRKTVVERYSMQAMADQYQQYYLNQLALKKSM